jgi:hypothetical protein
VLLFGSNMGDGARHNHFPLASAVVGGGCGTLKGNQHVRCEDRTPLANLLLTLLHRAGVNVETVGDATGEISQI